MGGCFVPGCRAGYNGQKGSHLFRPPKNQANEWIRIMNKLRSDKKFDPSNANHHVCSQHFLDEHLIKCDKFRINGEDVLLPRQKWKLMDDAIPTLFPNIPKSIQPSIPKKRRVLERVDTSNNRKKRTIQQDLYEIELESLASTSTANSTPFILDEWWTQVKKDFPGWIMDKSNQNTQSLLLINYDDDLPSIDKALVICNNNIAECHLYYRDSLVTSQVTESIAIAKDNLEMIMTRFDTATFCQGIRGFHNICEHEYGVKKKNVWYSTECAQMGKFLVCLKCRMLHQSLTRKLSTPSPRVTDKKSKSNSTDRARSRRHLKYYKARSKRLTLESRKMRRQLLLLKNSINNLDLSVVEKKLQQVEVPAPMKSSIIHSLKLAKVKSAKGVRYSSDWLFECLILKIKSPAAYRHLRESKILPLPHPSTLTKLISSQRPEFGFSVSSLKAIKKSFSGKSLRDRQGVLMFDEIQLRETLEFNPTRGNFQGYIDYGLYTSDLLKSGENNKLANHALVVMYRPLNDKWVQPIAAFATRNAANGTAIHKVIFEAIIKLEEVGAQVLAVVCDGSKPNKSFWKKCGIGIVDGTVRNKIQHPCCEDRNLFFCSDVPHLFKCVRNHFQKYTFTNFFGKEIDFTFYERLLIEDSKRQCGLRKCPKLTQSHVKPNNFEKMVVPLATQLFSRSVATGLSFYRSLQNDKFEGSDSTEHFTQSMNDLFDALNAQLPHEGIRQDSKSYIILREFTDNLNSYCGNVQKKDLCNVHFASKETLEALLITLTSTIEIIDYLIVDLGYIYVLTGKINQDCLEKFFGLIRAAGGREDHPTISNFIQLYRLLSLYNPVKRMLKGNVRSNEDMHVLVDFETSLRQDAKQFKQRQAVRKKEIEDILIEKLVDATGITTEDINIEISDRSIVYHLAGFLCFKSKKFLSCLECIASICVDNPEVDESISLLTNLMNYGPLHHPSNCFYQAILKLEVSVCAALEKHSTCGDIVVECVKNVSVNGEYDFGCSSQGHYENIITTMFPYYITMRMHFYTRAKRNTLGHGKATRNKRKESKLTN